MFKKGLDVLSKTKNAAVSSMTELETESDEIQNAKVALKNMKWSIKLLIQLAKNYFATSDKQVQQGTAFSVILQRFSEKISHTNYIINQTLPLSDSLREVGEGIKNSSTYFQQYTQIFCDKFATNIEALYVGHVKKVATLEKQQEESRIKYNNALNYLKSTQKSGHTGTKLAEKTTEYENAKAYYEQISLNLVSATNDMVNYVQREVAVQMKQFVAEQQLMVQECIKMWVVAENKLFNSQSPVNTTTSTTSPNTYGDYNNNANTVNLSKLSLDKEEEQPPQPYQPPQQHSPPQQTFHQSPPTDFSSQHQQYSFDQSSPQETYQPPQQQQQPEGQKSPNPFDDKNPFDN
ncbi:hypothetical protein ACTFIW_004991 [Dictyostelium discoideum]